MNEGKEPVSVKNETTDQVKKKSKGKRYIWLLVVLLFIVGLAKIELRNETGSTSEADLREGYIEGCIYVGDTRKHCECMFEKVIDRYGVEGFTKMNDWNKGMPKDKEKAEEYIINLTNTDKDFKDFVISVKGMSASCK